MTSSDQADHPPLSLPIPSRRGTRYYLRITLILTVVLPFLAFILVVLSAVFPSGAFPIASQIALAIITLTLSLSGFVLLRRYPKNTLRLREYLEHMARGELPEKVTLREDEDDIAAIEHCLNVILEEMRSRMEALRRQLERSQEMRETIQSQAKEILEAERQRVMLQSLTAACHHIGQPATVLRAHLGMMKKHAPPDKVHQLTECIDAAEAIADVLDRLRQVSTYRTVPYVTYTPSNGKADASHMIDIGR